MDEIASFYANYNFIVTGDVTLEAIYGEPYPQGNPGVAIRVAGDFASVGITLRIDKSGIGAALNLQRLNINLAHLELWLQRESVTLFQQSSILINNRVAAINHILG